MTGLQMLCSQCCCASECDTLLGKYTLKGFAALTKITSCEVHDKVPVMYLVGKLTIREES